MEPRIYATPGTINPNDPKPDDIQNSMVYYVSYGTTHHPDRPRSGRNMEEAPEPSKDVPKDLFWTMTDNFGETYMLADDDESTAYNETNATYPFIAHGAHADSSAQFAASQIRTNPAGNKFFASYLASNGQWFTGAGPCSGSGGSGQGVCYHGASMNPFKRYT